MPAPDARDATDIVYFGDAKSLLLRVHVQLDGKPVQDVWYDFVKKLFAYYDLDGDGVLTKKEMERLVKPQDLMNLLTGSIDFFNLRFTFAKPEEVDTNKDGKITMEEFAAYYSKAGGGRLPATAAQRSGASGQLKKATATQRHGSPRSSA